MSYAIEQAEGSVMLDKLLLDRNKNTLLSWK